MGAVLSVGGLSSLVADNGVLGKTSAGVDVGIGDGVPASGSDVMGDAARSAKRLSRAASLVGENGCPGIPSDGSVGEPAPAAAAA